MIRRRRPLFHLVLAQLGLLLLLGLPVGAEPDREPILVGEGKRDTLRELTGVEVVVEALDDGPLTSDALKADVEAQLETAGIRVLHGQERLGQPGFPYLYVRLSLLHTAPASSYVLEVSLNQTVILTRAPSTSTFAPTWSVHAMGVMTPFDAQDMRRTVSQYVDRFVQAFQAANAAESLTLR
ncbi:hypothetical protein [Candidatus Nitrospira bockiana]